MGVVVLRNFATRDSAEVLLIRRAKQPSKGLLCFPGGRLEWGETLAECAAREVLEETGITIQTVPHPPRTGPAAGLDRDLSHPRPLTTVDGLFQNEDGELAFHYVIVEV